MREVQRPLQDVGPLALNPARAQAAGPGQVRVAYANSAPLTVDDLSRALTRP